ncbi:hypothetical protein VNO77_11111 [Canavalia gladiata]|uniref:Uncharacterized protein n=1 Tax=Canavalia gladiata TaxID=3824 RepID=A0AAN9QV45_CANGL
MIWKGYCLMEDPINYICCNLPFTHSYCDRSSIILMEATFFITSIMARIPSVVHGHDADRYILTRNSPLPPFMLVRLFILIASSGDSN